MVFALERTTHALHLLSIEKTAQGFQIGRHETRPQGNKTRLGFVKDEMHWIQALQEMRETLTETTCQVYMSIHDDDLILQCLPAFECQNKMALYQYCQKALRPKLRGAIHHYSWDVQIVNAYQGHGYYVFCAAYPLPKVIFLQEISRVCDMTLQVIEPSICAIARFSHYFLHLPYALFLLQNDERYTLCLSVNSEIFAICQFHELAFITQHYLSWLSDPLFNEFINNITTLWTYPSNITMPTDFPLEGRVFETSFPVGIGLAIREHILS